MVVQLEIKCEIINEKILGQLPYYCEPKAPLFGESLITPNDLFFVPNHFPVPTDTAKEHELHIHSSGLFYLYHNIQFFRLILV